jgi:hypothetical protein
MWWPPETEDERRVAGILPGLQGRFMEDLSRGIVFGVGAMFAGGRLFPMLLLNQALAGVRLSAGRAPDPIFGRENFPPALAEYISGWNVPANTVYLPVSAPEPLHAVRQPASMRSRLARYFPRLVHSPLASSGSAIRCVDTRTRATLGVPLVCPKCGLCKAFLTVGHIVEKGSKIELVETHRWRPTRYKAIGSVVEYCNPSDTPGQPAYDFAVVHVDPSVQIEGPRHKGAARIRSPQSVPLLATLHGAISGIVPQAGIIGSLSVYGAESYTWKNSWLVLPSGLTSQGDSGGILILDSEQAVVGMMVGGSRTPNSTSYMAQYAEDMESLERDVLAPACFLLA